MKQISYNDAAYILRHKENHPCEKYLCNWFIDLENQNSGHIMCKVKMWVYILIFIPVHIFKFLYCLWDGGIKEFEIEKPTIMHYNVVGSSRNGGETQLGRLKIIYNSK